MAGYNVMQHELNRIASFRELSAKMLEKVPCLHLAKKGYYYTDGHVKTFCCGLEADPLEIGENVVEFHTKHAVHCSTFNQSDGPNTSGSKNIPFVSHIDPKAVGLQSQPRSQPIVTHSDPVQHTETLSREPDDREQIRFGRREQPSEFLELMKDEAMRLETYFDFPRSVPVSSHDLAKAGFFYIGALDRVKCIFCNGRLRDWEPEDDPMAEHRSHFPHCHFIQDMDVGNVPIPGNINVSERVRETVASHGEPRRVSPDESTTRPTHPSVETVKVNPAKTTAVLHMSGGSDKGNVHPASTEEYSLRKENNLLRESARCSVCLDEERTIVFLPCGHLVSCEKCAPRLRDCPVCRTYIKGTVHAFLS